MRVPDMDRKYSPGDLIDYKAVGAVIKDVKNRVLMQKHNKYGFWTIPVGKVEPDQTIKSALLSEIKDECGIVPIQYNEIARRGFKYIRMGNLINVDARLFEINRYEGIVSNCEPDKHSVQVFLSINEICGLDDISHMTQMYLDMIDKLPLRLNNLNSIL